jgi:protoporphyrinogen oxidase
LFSGSTLVLGGGPAGLTAAYVLAKQGRPVTVLERDATVGGLARTEERDGYRFDLGGHRFFTKCSEVEELWHEVLGEELLLRPRLSRIYYRGRFLDYPLRACDVIAKLGPLELTLALGSYLNAAFRHSPDENFEQWVSSRFGRRLYEMFFRSYTEKVWGVACTDLRAEWAAQRIRGLSLGSVVRAGLFGQRNGTVRSLITEFRYPRLGPGQMWETMQERIVDRGGRVLLETPVERLEVENGLVTAIVAGGERFTADHVISSLPLGAVVGMAGRAAPAALHEAARGLRYRDFLTVALVVRGDEPFPDNWVYVHDPDVKVARIQNYRAWSPWMVPDDETASIGMEYFCFEGDELWSAGDDELVRLASEELRATGLLGTASVERGYVVRVRQAYPIYDADYAARVELIRDWLAGVRNLQQVGRNGLHRYNNSDHSMLTAICAVENLNGEEFDLWSINTDSWYGEEQTPEEQPYIPAPALSGAVGD